MLDTFFKEGEEVDYHRTEQLLAKTQKNGVKKPTVIPAIKLKTLSDLLSEPEEITDWVVKGLLPCSGLSALIAKPKVGKSTLARQLALCVARGEDFLGYKTNRGLVVYLAFEERSMDVRNHFVKMGASETDVGIKVFAGMAPADAINAVRKMAEQERPTLIIVDTLARLVRIKDLNDYSQTTSGLEPVLALAREVGSHVCLLHHAKKGDSKGIDAILGSTGLSGTVDNIIQIHQSEKYRTISTIQRVGTALPETVLDFDVEHAYSSLSGSKHDYDVNEIKDEIVIYLSGQTEAITENDIHKEIEGKRTNKQKALRTLVSEGKVTRIGGGKRGQPYLYQHSGTQVPHITPEPENQNPKSNVITQKQKPDSGTQQFQIHEEYPPISAPETDYEALERESIQNEGRDK